MMRKKSIILLTITLILFFTLSSSAEWTTSSSEDEMTGEKSWYAISPEVSPTEEMGFPYNGTKAFLVVGTDGDSEWAYIGFSTEPNISDDETEDGYSVIKTRVKWDDEVNTMTFTQKWGSKFIHFKNTDLAISKIENSNSVLIEISWYGEGEVYFRFPLDGSSDAINKIRNSS
ncbi:MAG: hypothetical protein ACQESP_13440 [Candidatus Muiribacteriota bacterium]